MVSSINYNSAATSALRTLQSTNTALDSTQSRISTGLKIGQAKDNAAYWSIATTMKSDNKALGTVKDALGLGAGTVDTAYQGLDAARVQLDDMKTKLTSALNPNVDRDAVQKDIDAYLSSLKSIASSSVFSGENWLSVNSGVSGYSANKQVVSSYARDASGSVAIETINIDTSKIALFDANASGTGILSSQANLAVGGQVIDFGGNAATGAAPALNGLDTATVKAGLDIGVAAAAKIDMGKFTLAGLQVTDKLTLDISVDGGATTTATVSLAGVTDGNTFATNLQTAIRAATGTTVTAVMNADGNIIVTSPTSGSTSSVKIANLKSIDGDSTIATVTGYRDAAVNGVANLGTGSVNAVSVTFNSGGTAPAKLEAGEKLQFTFTYNGTLYKTAETTIAAGGVPTADDFKTLIKGMMEAAVSIPTDPSTPSAALGTGKIAIDLGALAGTATTGAIKITTVGKGDSQSLSITQVTVDGVAATGTNANGLVGGANGDYTPANAAGATAAIAAPGSNGDTISMDVTLFKDNGLGTGSVAVNKKVSWISSSAIATNAANLQAALDTAYGRNVLKVNTTDGSISTIAKGPTVGVMITNATATDGDGVFSSTVGLQTTALTGTGRDGAVAATKATVTSSTAFAGPLTFDAGDTMTFNVKLNDTVKAVKIDKTTIDAALGGTAGKILTADNYVTVLNAALANAGVSAVTAKNDTGVIKFETVTAGAADLSITDAKTSSGANTISVNEINITSASFKALTKDQQTQVINAYINVVSDKLKAVTSAATTMGSVSARIESQKTFVSSLMDTIDKGVSGLIDADMNEESTRLQALQVKQQLGVQALSIANQSAQSVLSLFRG